ncbi:MAG: tRNA (cytidine(56)-2'-O)-methyltransferase [Candidatus Diapherotrites archaeon]|nr:tRNA (cytidine(56)-2'-O)-methyltransferase [Candidatus Diapherotrites archaeon]MDZ4256960.1 tRNA (cytidine(56)-2'-O)-methyltransferase [archaeon]
MKPNIIVVRLSERGYRDLRITTHCALVARAFGAERIILSDSLDKNIRKTVEKVRKRFGGAFEVAYEKNIIQRIRQLKKMGWIIIHLTMYGEEAPKTVRWIRKKRNKNVVVVIGSGKVPAEVYTIADRNTSITRQPHSEVAALGVFLHYLMDGGEEKLDFPGENIFIFPNPKGKDVRLHPFKT